jgi:hypothetical protein
VLVLVGAGCGGEGSPQGAASAGADALESLPVGWSSLSAPPVVRARAVSLWTGTELFFWGGDTDFGGSHHDDGFTYDPATEKWRRLPDGPLTGRSSAAAIWTGDEVLVWGGYEAGQRPLGDGAAFDPATERWRKLPPAPLGPRRPATAVWTGRELLIWGNASRSQEARDGAAYDPAADRWRALPPAPLPLNEANAVWTGKEMVVFGALLDGNNHSKTRYAQGIAYDLKGDSWRELPHFPLSPQASSVAWTGNEVLAWDYELTAGAYDPDRNDWRELPDLPLRFGECYPESATVGEVVLAWYCGLGALLQISTTEWHRIARPPAEIYGRPMAAGRTVLFAGAAHEGVANALWAYVPELDRVQPQGQRIEHDGVSLAIPTGWDGRVLFLDPQGASGFLQVGNFGLPANEGFDPPQELPSGKVDPIKAMTVEDVLLTVLPCAALPGTGPGEPAPSPISLDNLAFRPAGDPSVPRGHTLAEGAFRFGERCLRISVDFGGPPLDALQARADDVLSSLSVKPCAVAGGCADSRPCSSSRSSLPAPLTETSESGSSPLRPPDLAM